MRHPPALLALALAAPALFAGGEVDGEGWYRSALARHLSGDRSGALADARRAAAMAHGGAARLLRALDPEGAPAAESPRAVDASLGLEYQGRALRRFLAGDLGAARDEARRALARDPGSLIAAGILRGSPAARIPPAEGDLCHTLLGGDTAVKVTGSLCEETLSNALSLVAARAAAPLVIAGDSQAPVTVSFRDVSPPEALRAILAAARYTLAQEGGAVVAKPLDPKAVETRLFRLQNLILEDNALASATAAGGQAAGASAAPGAGGRDPLEAVRGALSSAGRLSYESSSRILVVTDQVENLQSVEKLVKELDRLPPQVLIRAQVVEVLHTDLLRLGFDWDLTYNLLASSARRPTTFPFFEARDPISSFRPEKDPADGDFPPGNPRGGRNLFPFVSQGDFAFGTLTGGNLGVALELEEVISRSEILSAPRVVVQEGKRAEIQVGERVPIPTATVDSETGQTTVTGFDEERVGILLEVIPHVLEGGNIRLSVHPEVSAITSFVGEEPIVRPIVATREVTTQVVVANGSTLVIGGLIRDSDLESTDRVPWIHKLPLLGRLFRKKSRDGEKTEVVVFITVEIVGPGTRPTEEERAALGRKLGAGPPAAGKP